MTSTLPASADHPDPTDPPDTVDRDVEGGPRKAAKVVPAAILYVTTGQSAGRVFRVEEERATIGRDHSNTHVLEDPRVSRVHAGLQSLSDVVILTDLGSTGGTWVGDECIASPTVLAHGDPVRFGPVELTFEHPVGACRSEDVTEVHKVPEPETESVSLSPRKLDVVRLLAEGLTNAQVADRLGLAELTVKSYTDELYRELDVHSRAAAVAEALRLGLL